MGIIGYIKNLIGIETPQETQKVSSVKPASTNEPIELVSKETAAKNKNEDTVEIKTRTREQVYKLIEDLCADYRMKMEDVKKAGLLEQIAGCSTEELLKKSDEELQAYINPLKHTLKWLSWKLPWQDRNIDDINKIAKQANERYIYTQTGRSFLGNMFRSRADLSEKLSNAGCELTEAGVKTYFKKLIADAIASGNKEKIQKAYDDALVTFGDLLNDTEDPHQKELLTAAISQLQAGKRVLAANLSIASCRNEKAAVQATARGLSNNYEEITCTADAFGECTSDNDNVQISHISFSNMSEEDTYATLAKMKSRRQELEAKMQSGEELTEAEKRYYGKAQCSQYAGAITGTQSNSYIENPNQVISNIDNDIHELGIQREVYGEVQRYLGENPNSIPVSKEEFTAKMDKATNGRYSASLMNETNSRTEQEDGKQALASTEKNIISESRPQAAKSSSEQSVSARAEQTVTPTTRHKEYSSVTSSTPTENKQQNAQIPQEIKKFTQAGNKEFKQYVKENGSFNSVVDAFNNAQYMNTSTLNYAARIYANLSETRQADILKRVNNAGLNELLKYTSDATLINLKGETLSNFYATKLVNDKAEEIEEKQAC